LELRLKNVITKTSFLVFSLYRSKRCSLRYKRTTKKKVTNCSCSLLSWAHDCNPQVPLVFTIDIRQVASTKKVLQMSRNRAVTRSKEIGGPTVVCSQDPDLFLCLVAMLYLFALHCEASTQCFTGTGFVLRNLMFFKRHYCRRTTENMGV
jgi:hypothetical protein